MDLIRGKELAILILNRHSRASAIQNHVLGLEGTAHQPTNQISAAIPWRNRGHLEAILVRFSSSVFEFWPHSDSESPSIDFRVLIRNRIGEQFRVGTLIQNRSDESPYLDLLFPVVLKILVFSCEELLVFWALPFTPKMFGGSLSEG